MSQIVHLRFFVDHENLLFGDPGGQISNGVILPISQTSYKRITILREQPPDKHHHIGFDVASFLQDFLLDCREEFLRFGQQYPIDPGVLANIVLGEFVERQGSHCEPDDSIPVFLDVVNELVIAFMEIIHILDVVVETSDITLGHGSIEITDQELVLLAVEINLSRQTVFTFQFKSDPIFPISQVQLRQDFLVGHHGLHVPILIEVKVYSIYEHFIDVNLDLRLNHVRPETGQKRSGEALAIVPLDGKDITGASHEGRLVEGAEQYFGNFGKCLSHMNYTQFLPITLTTQYQKQPIFVCINNNFCGLTSPYLYSILCILHFTLLDHCLNEIFGGLINFIHSYI